MRARRRFGQHFLEPVWVRKVVDAIGPARGERFLEIGPGHGALTLALAERGVTLVAVEIDRELAAALAARAPATVQVVAGDFLDVDLAGVLARFGDPDSAGAVRIAGNLPYNVASPILFKLLAAQRERAPFGDATLMLQREVAVRLVARPCSKDYGVLAILVQAVARPHVLLALPPGAFRPAPKVQSTVVRLDFGPPPCAIDDFGVFEGMVRSMFGQRRKTLANALKAFAATRDISARDALTRAALDPRRRPETLDLPEVARLAGVFGASNRAPVL